jgi:hypothetical protein
MTFEEILNQAFATPELIAEFDRLTGSNLQQKGSVIERMIDNSTDRTRGDVKAFMGFVFEYIFLPLLEQMETHNHD